MRRRGRAVSLGAMAAAGFFAVLAAHQVTSAVVHAQPLPGAAASEDAPAGPRVQGRYKATRRIVVDKQTRQLRTPTAEEVDQLVLNLATLTKRSSDGLPQTEVPGGGVAVDLAGGFGGVVLARPNEDGTFETRCVFTFEEGAEFLGLVREDA